MKRFNILLLFAVVAISSCGKKEDDNKRTDNSYQLIFTEQVNDSTTRIVKISDDGTGRTILNDLKNPINTGQVVSNNFIYFDNSYNLDSTSLYLYNTTTNASSFLHKNAYSDIASLSNNGNKIAFYENRNLSIRNKNL